jgi:hypothetical protein
LKRPHPFILYSRGERTEMNPKDYVTELERFADDIRHLRNDAEELFERTPQELSLGDSQGELLEEIREVSSMLREDLEDALDRAERILDTSRMIFVLHGVGSG